MKISLQNTLLVLFLVILLAPSAAQAQQVNVSNSYLVDTLIKPIPTQRGLWTTRVFEAIDLLDKRDGFKDSVVKFRDENSTKIATKALIKDAYGLVVMVENMEVDHATKIRYHKFVETSLRKLNDLPWSEITAKDLAGRVGIIRDLLINDYKKTLTDYVEKNPNFIVLDYIDGFDDEKAKGKLYEILSKKNPEKLIDRLPKIANEPYADYIVSASAKVVPATILSYAQSNSILSSLVRRNTDPLVKTIVKIADQASNKIKVLPFLGAINRGEKTIKEIDNIANNEDKYFQALVDLIVADEKLGRVDIEKEINVRAIEYIRKINALHEAADNIRFASIQNFRDVDYYVMIIAGQDEIYTSSFTRGPFAQLIKKMEKKKGNELLDQLHYYHFKTFIRVIAGFSRLSEFLSTMDEEQKTALMKKFVTNLELGDKDDLSDAVDVADAYGSIKDTILIQFLKDEIVSNYERVKSINNQKGIVVYGLLASIFNQTSSNNMSDLPIPPITFIPVSEFKTEQNEIVEQMFFYGDGDGRGAYQMHLRNLRSDKRLKIDESAKYWTVVTSNNTPNKLTIYINKPLPEPEDETAQRALKKYLDENNIVPTVVVHRGHSYFLPSTLEYLTPDIKVIMLGSCGGYQNLSNILNTAADAHIISSKQTGTGVVNETILRELHNELMTNKELNWINIWKDLNVDFSKLRPVDREYFSDYVPPYKNLGAIFIKAYRKVMADS